MIKRSRISIIHKRNVTAEFNHSQIHKQQPLAPKVTAARDDPAVAKGRLCQELTVDFYRDILTGNNYYLQDVSSSHKYSTKTEAHICDDV